MERPVGRDDSSSAGRAASGVETAPTGVCVLRVRREGGLLRYRLVLTPDVSSGQDEVREFVRLDDVVAAVRAFLVAASTPTSRGPL